MSVVLLIRRSAVASLFAILLSLLPNACRPAGSQLQSAESSNEVECGTEGKPPVDIEGAFLAGKQPEIPCYSAYSHCVAACEQARCDLPPDTRHAANPDALPIGGGCAVSVRPWTPLRS
jgi:hypothetical protein